MKNTIIYQTSQKTPLILIGIFMVIAFLLLGMIFFPAYFNVNEAGIFTKIMLLIITLADLILFWSFSELRVRLFKDHLQVSFGVFQKKLMLNDIKYCSAEDVTTKEFIGYGIRLGKNKAVGYLARGKRGIRLKTALRDYFVSCDEPEVLCQKINQQKNVR